MLLNDSSLGTGSNLPPLRNDLMRVELLAIDLDGTLLRTNKALSRRTAQAVSRAAKCGVRVVLASARPPRSMRVVYSYLELDTLQVNYNGAVIYDPKRGRHVYHQPIGSSLATRLVRLARRIDPGVIVSIEILDRWYTDHIDDSLPTETSRHFAPDVVGPLDAFLHQPVTKLLFLAPPPRLKKIRRTIKEAMGPCVAVTTSDEHMIQVVHPHVDKATALAMIARHYNVATKAVMAIGDAPNDVGMIRWAGLGVAVENAWPAVRLAADAIVPSNDDDGVAHAIERYVLPAYPQAVPSHV